MSHNRQLKAGLEPRWNGCLRQCSALLPAEVRGWLLDTGSVTARLQAHCPDGFSVRLRQQSWGRPLYSEARLLHCRRGVVALVREVDLLCHGLPWVFARSIIPATSLRGSTRRLCRLGERPLGQVLFSDPRMRRGGTEIARLLPRHRLFSDAVSVLQQLPSEVWGRRTLFYLAGRPLLVNEIFLPNIPASPL